MAILKKPVTKIYKPGNAVTAKEVNDIIETALDATEKSLKAENLQVGEVQAVKLPYGSEPTLNVEIDTSSGESCGLLNLKLGVPEGERGPRISTGETLPTEDIQQGDLFIEKGTCDLYENNNEVWERADTLKGPDGSTASYEEPSGNGFQFKFAGHGEGYYELMDLERELLLNRDGISFALKNEQDYVHYLVRYLAQISFNQDGVSIVYENNYGLRNEILLNDTGIVLKTSIGGYYNIAEMVIDSYGIRFNGISLDNIMHFTSLFGEFETIKGRLNQLEMM